MRKKRGSIEKNSFKKILKGDRNLRLRRKRDSSACVGRKIGQRLAWSRNSVSDMNLFDSKRKLVYAVSRRKKMLVSVEKKKMLDVRKKKKIAVPVKKKSVSLLRRKFLMMRKQLLQL